MGTVDLTNISLNLLLIIIGGTGTLIGIIVSHFLARNRSINELLFTARKEAYSEFMREFGMAFGPEKISFKDYDAIKAVETEYERRQKINRIFAQCRLVSNPLLEVKLRDLYDLVIDDLEDKKLSEKKPERSERDYIGLEIEALMRHDLNVIGIIETTLWRLFSFLKRWKLKRKKSSI